MIKSMTGFGRAKKEINGREYIVEIKSVNHKYNDVTVRLPRSISYLEDMIKKEIANQITRGKIDIGISFDNYSDMGKDIIINKELAKLYIQQMKELAKAENIIDDISVMQITRLPEVLNLRNEEDEEQIATELKQCLQEAILQFIEMRTLEGQKMAEDMQQRAEEISQKIAKISKSSAGLIQEYVVKLETRIKELLKTEIIDEARLAQEVVIYSDKCSVEEEITRLKSHISQFLLLIADQSQGAIGKRLDFLLQEMNRETNTIGSKANCLAITNFVIEIKTELENIREQVQNIE